MTFATQRTLASATAMQFLLVFLGITSLLSKTTTASNPSYNDANNHQDDPSNPCLIYLAESTIPNAGLGMFAGAPFHKGQLIGRTYGDAAIPTTDQNWHNTLPNGKKRNRHNEDYHWPLINYDWVPKSLKIQNEADEVAFTVPGFGAAPNCHFRLLNVKEHGAMYDTAGLDRYTDPGSGAITPFFNRSSTARKEIETGSEFFVNYGSGWFTSREDEFGLVPVRSSYANAEIFLDKYGKMLIGKFGKEDSDDEDYDEDEDDIENEEWKKDLIEEKMILTDEAQHDLWHIIKTFPYPSREREALPGSHSDGIIAIHGGIESVEIKNSIRDLEYLQTHGKCMDNIAPGLSSIPQAGRGAFATRFIPKGGLVAPAPVLHIADKNVTNMYDHLENTEGKLIPNLTAPVSKQPIFNYCFGHPNSSVLLFPYSSNVAYINHDSTNYNAELRWATNFSFFHHEEWLNKSFEFLEDQWTAGLALEFVATRDILPEEEVLINYGEQWQKAWDEHVKNWVPISKESDYNNLTYWTTPTEYNTGKLGYGRAEVLNSQIDMPIKTVDEQKTDPYPSNVMTKCYVDIDEPDEPYEEKPETMPYFERDWVEDDLETEHTERCEILDWYKMEKYEYDDEDFDEEDYDYEHGFLYTVGLNITVDQEDISIRERHVIYGVPWRAIEFENKPYT